MLASLTLQIQFTGFNNETIILPPDTLILVDQIEGIATYNGHAFDVFHFEYSLIN